MPLGDPRQRLIYNAYKNKISGYPDVLGVTVANEMPGGLVNDILFTPDGAPEEELVRINNMWIDHDFIRTMGIELTAGRDFSRSFPTDTLQAFVINEAAVKWLGWEGAPLDRKIRLGNFKDGRVIGVVRDFHVAVAAQRHRTDDAAACARPGPAPLSRRCRITPDDLAETMGFLESNWRDDLSGRFVHVLRFSTKTSTGCTRMKPGRDASSGAFSILAVFIACLGLLGLASFTAEQRTREIGVRKVLGASVFRHRRAAFERIRPAGRVRQPHRLAHRILRDERLARRVCLSYGPFSLDIRARRGTGHCRYDAYGKLPGRQRRPIPIPVDALQHE